jgi:hypothetical protein
MKLKYTALLVFVFVFSNLKAQNDPNEKPLVVEEFFYKAVKVILPPNMIFVLTPNYHNGNGSRRFYIGNNTVFKPTSGSNDYYIEAGSMVVRGNESWSGPLVLLNDGEKIIENPFFIHPNGSKFAYNTERIVKRQKVAQSKFMTRLIDFMGALGQGFNAGHRHHHHH